MKYYRTGYVARTLRVSPITIFRWIHQGRIKAEMTPAKRWLIPESELNRLMGVEPSEVKKVIIYARVSSSEQKAHLASQARRLEKYADERGYEVVKVYEELASGLNENRRKLESAYRMLKEKKADLILVEFSDRLSRFGFNYLARLAESYDASVEVVNGDAKKDAMQELVEDMISIVTIFSARLYGLRSQKFRQVTRVMKSAVHG
ncbi:MAG: IS607 family transposase [Nitrososphaerota archaeon]|nr:IS607 family transposase [Nitrososphaerota archaeon]MDG6960600.1 IS607 family transposase [Nitrososphaerota archaeon]MDG6965445.1 IS607 family transposase [Nitrososphaerota archaeon]MDG6987589.1 IS607 family transposase [Nitrososphaerota archaeon]MDG7014904.1 IS607 family transposase [Nitrososphaerota archaeon]